jgi:hypothetical protein
MRGMICRWWKLAMTDATPSLEFASWLMALVRGSSLLCLTGGDTPYTHMSGFSFNTFPMYSGRPGSSLQR